MINRVLSIKETVLVVQVTMVRVRSNGHNNSSEISEPSKQLRYNIDHCFRWTVVSNTRIT